MGLSTRYSALLLVVIAIAALILRLSGLEQRPFHGDEANQAFRTGTLLETGVYEYDPHDHHGPTLYYLTLIPAWLAGQDSFEATQDWTYRIVPVFFGAGLIMLMLLFRPGLNSGALLFSGILVCLSPAFVFYSRYYIQEMLLVFFTVASIGFGYRYLMKPSLFWALATGSSLSLMHATKETAVLAYAAMGAGLVMVAVLEHKEGFLGLVRAKMDKRHVIGAVLIALAVNILLYTSFFTHARGPLDSLLTYGNYIQRADGAGLHDKPWDYYLRLLLYSNRGPQYWFSEGFIMALGTVGMLRVFVDCIRKKKVDPLLVFLATYALCLTGIYALIPYKTPWSMLSFFHAILLMGGYGFYVLYTGVKSYPAKIIYLLVCIVGVAHLGYQSYSVNVKIPADVRNPYVYAHTSSAALRVVERAHQLKTAHPDPENMVVFVIQPDGDYWPLPYYLRGIKHVGFYETVPDVVGLADMVIVAPVLRGELKEALPDYVQEMGALRPSVLRMVYIRRELWDTFMETQE